MEIELNRIQARKVGQLLRAMDNAQAFILSSESGHINAGEVGRIEWGDVKVKILVPDIEP